jgi:glutathione S-transferase
MLMLRYKQVPFECSETITGLHPLVARLHGFNAGGQQRTAGGKRTVGLRLGDMFGTVPGLASGPDRISTNYAIARFLDARHPDPPLLPADPARRAQVEAVESWANDTLQMDARRILGPAVLRDPDGFSRSSADGRLGSLLYRRRLARRYMIPRFGPMFAASEGAERDLLAKLPATLDQIDGWIAEGTIGGEQPNVADFMIVPSLALILYRSDLQPVFAGRPALALLDRLLPEPA